MYWAVLIVIILVAIILVYNTAPAEDFDMYSGSLANWLETQQDPSSDTDTDTSFINYASFEDSSQ